MSKNRKKRNNTTRQKVNDAYSNPSARLGVGTMNLGNDGHYVMQEMTWDLYQLTAMYRDNGIVKKIIEEIPKDMLKGWYELKTKIDGDAKRKITRLERTMNLQSKIFQGLTWGRLYGGAIGIIVIDGDEDILDEPLDLEYVMPDSFKNILIYDRWCGIMPSTTELIEDANDPECGLPMYYTVTGVYDKAEEYQGVKIHHSRIIRFVGDELPYYQTIQNMYWGSSVIESVYEAIKNYDGLLANISALVYKANLRVYGIKDFDTTFLSDERDREDFAIMIEVINYLFSNQGMMVTNAENRVDSLQYSFAGIGEVVQMAEMAVCAVTGYPATKLFGRSPDGMNATGTSDAQNYYERIENEQEARLRPIFDRLLPLIFMSEFGAVPDDLDYEFVSPRQPTEEERKNILAQVSSSITQYMANDVINQKMALTAIRNSTDLTGLDFGITDEDIENASETFFPTGEFESAIGGMDQPNPIEELPPPQEEAVDSG